MRPCVTLAKRPMFLHALYVAILHQKMTESQTYVPRGPHLRLL